MGESAEKEGWGEDGSGEGIRGEGGRGIRMSSLGCLRAATLSASDVVYLFKPNVTI